MTLETLIRTIGNYRIYPAAPVTRSQARKKEADSFQDNFEVKGISCNSKKVLDNYIFIAIKGNSFDGHEFIREAVDRGAKAVIVQGLRFELAGSGGVPLISVKDTRLALARLATEFYGNPSEKIKVIGITGTNGKTTVSYLIEAILKESGLQPAVVGTVNYRFKDRVLTSTNTTPGPIELQSMLDEMSKEGARYAIMEVSSHALTQHRTEGIDFHSAVFTNLTQDHLDYHKTKENYFQAKARLFKNINPRSSVIINNDDGYGRRIKKLTCGRITTYGIDNPADVVAKDIKFDLAHTEFILAGIAMGEKTNFSTKLIGRHNVYNILSAVSWALTEGLDLSVIKSAIEKFDLVPGRLERISSSSDFSVFVDYAHTEDALKNVIRTLRELSPRRIIVVFGCGGERDRTKRPRMGHAVSELADYAVITDDNPRSEDPQGIIEEIKKGIRKDNYLVVSERKEAIKKALSLAKSGDIVLVAGKGHENYQILKDKRIHFDDREVIRECLESRNY